MEHKGHPLYSLNRLKLILNHCHGLQFRMIMTSQKILVKWIYTEFIPSHYNFNGTEKVIYRKT